MIKILFVCHGNICRSPMAEFVFKDKLGKLGISDKFYVASAAASREEIGNPVHPGTRRKLEAFGISVEGKYAVLMTKKDYDTYDYIIGMDGWNIRNIKRIIGADKDHKVFRLLDFTDSGRDIADPWYTGNFEDTYRDVCVGCDAFIKYLKDNDR